MLAAIAVTTLIKKDFKIEFIKMLDFFYHSNVLFRSCITKKLQKSVILLLINPTTKKKIVRQLLFSLFLIYLMFSSMI